MSDKNKENNSSDLQSKDLKSIDKESPKETSKAQDSIDDLISQINKFNEQPQLKKLISEFDKKTKDFKIHHLIETNKKIVNEFQNVRKERDEYLDLLQRFKADFENYKKRSQKQLENNMIFSSEKIISKIFIPLEDLDRVIRFANEKKIDVVSLDGLKIINNKMHRILEDEGLTIINPKIGETFDPKLHEAISIEVSEKHKPGVIIHLIERGYKINNRVITAAKVMISAEDIKEKESEKKEGKKIF